MSQSPGRKTNSCPPRFATPRTLERKTRGHEVAAIAKALGTPLMPWQRYVADVALELDEDGLPAYRQVVVTVGRQCGKTLLVLAYELQRALMWATPQVIAYGAADGLAARKKLLDDHVPILLGSELAKTKRTIYRANGREAIYFKNGSRIEIVGSSESAAHGKTINLAIADEIWSDPDHRREQALFPTMNTVADAQYLLVSTAGTEASVYLRSKVEAGRQAVLEGRTSGTAYFEWSAPDDAPYDDPATWRACLPALGHTISERVIADALEVMDEDEFRRAYLNQWTGSVERVIPALAWEAVCADVSPQGRLAFGVDINPERTWSSIAVMDANGVGELGAYGAGTSWVASRVIDLAKKHRAPVAIDTAGPAGTLVPELENAGVAVVKLSGKELAHACASLYDAIADAKVMVRNAPPLFEALDQAVAVATKRPLGDAWAFSRKSTQHDISPLMALTLAHWALTIAPPPSDYRILSLT